MKVRKWNRFPSEWRIGNLKSWSRWLLILLVLTGFSIPLSAEDAGASQIILFDFGITDTTAGWRTMSDQVIGGSSTAIITPSPENFLIFSGTLAPDSYYNFCLIHSPIQNFQLRSFGGLVIRLKGDGKYYQVRIYNHDDISGVYYRAGFKTRPNRLMTFFLPFSSFIPCLNNRVVRDWPVLDQSRILRMGIDIADQVPGNFRLELFWIKARER